MRLRIRVIGVSDVVVDVVGHQPCIFHTCRSVPLGSGRPTVEVPLNTMLADLDKTLRTLLREGARASRLRRRRHRV